MGNVGQKEVFSSLHDVFLHYQMFSLSSHLNKNETTGLPINNVLMTPLTLSLSLDRFRTNMHNTKELLMPTNRFRELKDFVACIAGSGYLVSRLISEAWLLTCILVPLLDFSMQVVSGVCYVSTYEGVRHLLDINGMTNSRVKALAGGSCASLVGQTVIVPFDVISQHMMVLGLTPRGKSDLSANTLAVNTEGRTRWQITWDITRTIYVRDGLRGFYR